MTAPATGETAASGSPLEANEGLKVGRNELGRIDVAPRAVEKIAALAALEVPDAGGVGGGFINRAVAGAPGLGWLRSSSGKLPKVSADVDGALAYLDVELSVRWPAPIAQVTDAVRERIGEQIGAFVGLAVREVNIQVVELVTEDAGTRVA